MTTYNTGNPIGSTDARDRLDNSENMDILENSTTLNEHPDRLGVMRKTRKGMELEHDNQIAAHEDSEPVCNLPVPCRHYPIRKPVYVTRC